MLLIDPEKRRAYFRRWYAKNKVRQCARTKERYRRNKVDILAKAKLRYHGRYRDTKLAKTYGVTKTEARKWLAVQRCEICKATDRRLTLDHQHGTQGKIRGRLCTNCNSGLGQFKDSPDTLELAAQYLRDRMEKKS